MNIQLRKIVAAVATATLGLSALPAAANLVLQGANPVSGSGLGAVFTVLTLNGSGTETGSVTYTGLADLRTGDFQQQTQTRTFGELGITDASQIGIVFNASEPGNDAQVNLAGLSLIVQSSTGGTLFNSGAVVCAGNPTCSLTNTFSGTGNSGFLFVLDSEQVALANAVFLANAASGIDSFRIGLSASVQNASGGLETFYVTNTQAVVAIPEPEAYALMLAGLGVVGFVARRRKNRV